MAIFIKMMVSRVFVFAALAGVLPAVAQDTSLFNYPNADRQQKLIAAAQKEGTFTLYTSIVATDYQALITPFEKQYGIKVKVWRSSSTNVLHRILSEAAAKRHEVDAVFTDVLKLEALHREKSLQPVNSPRFADLNPGSVPPHREWVACVLTVWVQAYNTKLIKKDELPKTYQDLADPKWKGKLGIEGKIPEWYATVATDIGEENGIRMFQNIVRNGTSVRQGLSVLNNLVVAGEVPLAMTVFHHMPIGAKRDGAPIDWFVLEPAVARANGIGILRRAAHPNAALLFYEHLLTPEMQKLLVELDFVPTNSKVASPLGSMRVKMVDPYQSPEQIEKWRASFEEVVIKGPKN